MIVCTRISVSIVHYILTKLSFNEIDFSKARLTGDDQIVIDMNSERLRNRDVNIIPCEKMIVTERDETV